MDLIPVIEQEFGRKKIEHSSGIGRTCVEKGNAKWIPYGGSSECRIIVKDREKCCHPRGGEDTIL
jgi:hypothetical protein